MRVLKPVLIVRNRPVNVVFVAIALQGQHNKEDALSRHPPTDSSVDIEVDKKVEEFLSHSTNHADAQSSVIYCHDKLLPLSANDAIGEEAVNVIADSFRCPIGEPGTSEDKSKEGRGPLNLPGVCKLSMLYNAAVQQCLNPSAEGEDTVMAELDVTEERSRLEGRLDASSQETLKVHGDVKTALRRWEHEILEQKRLLANQAEEGKKFRELLTNLRDSVCESKIAIGQLREDVSCLRPIRADIMDSVLGIALGQLYCDNRKLREDFGKCQKQIESAKERAGQHREIMDGDRTWAFLWESTAKEMLNSIATFSSLVSTYKNPGEHNPFYSSVMESDIWMKAGITRDHDWTDLLKHFICVRLFDNFPSETFASNQGEVLFLDRKERARKCLQYFKCSENKGPLQMAISHSRKDEFDLSFFKYLTSRTTVFFPQEFRHICKLFQYHNELTAARLHRVLSGIDVHSQKLIESILLAIDRVWQFHKLCFSFEPPATMFRVQHGSPFDTDYMESIESLEDDNSNFPDSTQKVGLVIYPGFRFRQFVIKSKVLVVTV